MSRNYSVSPGAALIAVATALIVGVLAALALRPPGTVVTGADAERAAATHDRIRWRVASAFSTNLPVLGDAVVSVTRNFQVASGGAIELQVFDPGEVVPVFGITEAVREGKIQAGFTWVGYDQGRIPASTLISAVPFGMEPMEFSAWWYHDDGRALGEALYHEHGVQPVLCGLIGPETAGWFRAPIESLEDLRGLKIRFAGLGGKVLQRLGASVTMIPGGEVFQALEKGTIDASEFSLPVVDAALGFGRVAKFNYFPGWHQPFTSAHLLIKLDLWRNLSEATRRFIDVTCQANVTSMFAQAEAEQGKILGGFAQAGISAETLPREMLETLRRTAMEVLDEEAADDLHFAKILASQRAFSARYGLWKRKGYLPRDF